MLLSLDVSVSVMNLRSCEEVTTSKLTGASLWLMSTAVTRPVPTSSFWYSSLSVTSSRVVLAQGPGWALKYSCSRGFRRPVALMDCSVRAAHARPTPSRTSIPDTELDARPSARWHGR